MHPCRKCGNICGSTVRDVCWKCPSVDYSHLAPYEVDQIVGLFFGEGNINLHDTKAGQNVVVSISLRDDDEILIRWLHDRLGGGMWKQHQPNKGHPMTSWGISRSADSCEFLRLIKERAIVPSKKLAEIDLILKWHDWRFSLPRNNIDTSYGDSIREELLRIRAYTSKA